MAMNRLLCAILEPSLAYFRLILYIAQRSRSIARKIITVANLDFIACFVF